MKISINQPSAKPWHFYLAGKIYIADTIIAILGCLWALMISSPWLILVFAGLWILSTLLYLEWRNGA